MKRHLPHSVSWPLSLAAILVPLSQSGCRPSEKSREAPEVPVVTAPARPRSAVATSESVLAALVAANPQLVKDAVQLTEDDGQIVRAEMPQAGVVSLEPLRGQPLQVLSLVGNPITDLSPLAGMPLVELDLEGTDVSDLTPLKGMPLRSLWLNRTKVTDLEPLRGLPLAQLSLYGVAVSDLRPLDGAPLESLWLNHTAVRDLSPLSQAPLVSVTLEDTPVTDLSIARQWPSLQRLHLGGSGITDLTPLQGLRLSRLILTPGRIEKGWDVVRRMDTLQELDVELREPQRWTPEEFWQRYDAGEFRR